GSRAPVEEFAARRRADSIGDERSSVPVRYLSEHPARDPASVGSHGGGDAMTALAGGTRREFLKAGCALVVGFGLRGVGFPRGPAAGGSVAGPPAAKQIDTWLAIHADNPATVYVGFAELGQGASTALLQIAADELDLGMEQIKSVRLDTNVTPKGG